MYNHTLKTTQQTDCQNPTCELIDLAPFTYTLTVKKEGYKDATYDVTVLARDLVEITVTLEKQLILEAKEEPVEIVLNREPTQRQQEEEKIRQESYISFDIDGKIWYFTQNEDSTLTLSERWMAHDTQYMMFQHVPKSKLALDKIYQTEAEIYIRHGDDIYFFDTRSGNMQKVFFPQDIQYIKKQPSGIYHLVTKVGTYLYQNGVQEPTMFIMFRDFVPYEDGYLGIIFADDTQRKKNYQIEQSGNLVVRYTPATKEMKVLEEVAMNIVKIVQD